MIKNPRSIVTLRDVNFSYHGDPVLDRISLDIQAGQYLGIIGPNGGGKTTLLKLILGLLKPQAGTIELFNQPVSHFKNWAKVGYVSQRATSFDTKLPITVEEVVALGRVGRVGLFKRLTTPDHVAVTTAMSKVDILPLRQRLITELSGGQQQRVFIAKALAAGPEILFLDEPTVGIDIKSQDSFYQLLSKLNREEGLTLVMVSHDIDVIVNEVTTLACINDTLIYHGAPQEFVKQDYLANLYGKERKFILHGH